MTGGSAATCSARRVVVVGGGIIGLSCADALLSSGHDVTVFDPEPGYGATRAAAGMLAPASEAWFGEEDLLRLGLASARRWPEFAARLQQRSGRDVDLRTDGTLLVGLDHHDVAEIRRTTRLLAELGQPAEDLDRREVRAREPVLGPRVTGGAHLPHDHAVNPRRVADALLAVLGERVVHRRAVPFEDGVVLEDGSTHAADVVVLATGEQPVGHVRPVLGEVVVVRSDDPPARVLRARAHGRPVYLVPRAGGDVVVGATQEEHPVAAGRPPTTVGGVFALLEAAREVVPGIDTAEIVEVLARYRPGSPDNGPLVGWLPGPPGKARRLLAAGHFRGGVLQAPLTAEAVQAYVDEVEVPAELRPFTPDRFDDEEEPGCA